MNPHPEIKAKGKPEWTTLLDHLSHVKLAIEKMAAHTGFDIGIAGTAAILHDIGKVHPVFQQRLQGEKSSRTFRHELASLFFLPLADGAIQEPLIEMIVAHHKSIYGDRKLKGILDLENNEADVFSFHLGDWELWSPVAMDILSCLGMPVRSICRREAEDAYYAAVDYCYKKRKESGYSAWRGLLMGADHLASAMADETERGLQKMYQQPKLHFFDRQHPLYPLSCYPADSPKPHTMVVASTGAGKTDYLLRRCRSRVFYTLPFQASINAMYFRLSRDLQKDNPDLDIRVLHAASALIEKDDDNREEIILQKHPGSAIKVLTPFQLAGMLLGSKGFEAMMVDIRGCDVILDEVHTYSTVSQAIVLKLIALLKTLGCRLHIGTATMPSVLYNRILGILGKECVLETKLSATELCAFNRHWIYKQSDWASVEPIVQKAVEEGKKILLVCNRVADAQQLYQQLAGAYPEVDKLLLHSRMKRKDRRQRELLLMGLDSEGNPTHRFNTAVDACIVVSTQVVEVSLDISFDLMITACAPLDALIQRFGRVNRKRSSATAGLYKPIYVLAPPADDKTAKPYDLAILQRSFEMLPDGELLEESSLQEKMDAVFPAIDFLKIEEVSAFQDDGSWSIAPLTNGSAWLLDMLDIDSVACILEQDYEPYRQGNLQARMELEIPVRYWTVKNYARLEFGNGPYLIPDEAYDAALGLLGDQLKKTSINHQIS